MKFSSKASVIPTFTGRLVNPLDLKPEDVDIVDIAHHLARIGRYTGATRGDFAYSVAQHSVSVSLLCPENRLWGLLHDASEAYLNDIARPLKYAPSFAAYKEFEALAMAAIATRFGLQMPEPKEVKWADNKVLATEYRDLMSDGSEFHTSFLETLPEPMNRTIVPWEPNKAEEAFLYQYDLITGDLKALDAFYRRVHSHLVEPA